MHTNWNFLSHGASQIGISAWDFLSLNLNGFGEFENPQFFQFFLTNIWDLLACSAFDLPHMLATFEENILTLITPNS
jgi:hypothetical protein